MRVRFLLVTAGVLVLAVASPAYAGGPTDITVTPPGAAPIELSIDGQADLFERLNQVSYQAGLENGRDSARPSVIAPVVPGPRYLVQVAYHRRPAYEYEWYPRSSDGPRIFVPGQQPGNYGMPGEPGWYPSTESMVVVLRQVESVAASPPPSVAGAGESAAGVSSADGVAAPVGAPTPLPARSPGTILGAVAMVGAVVTGLVLLSRRWRMSRAAKPSRP